MPCRVQSTVTRRSRSRRGQSACLSPLPHFVPGEQAPPSHHRIRTATQACTLQTGTYRLQLLGRTPFAPGGDEFDVQTGHSACALPDVHVCHSHSADDVQEGEESDGEGDITAALLPPDWPTQPAPVPPKPRRCEWAALLALLPALALVLVLVLSAGPVRLRHDGIGSVFKLSRGRGLGATTGPVLRLDAQDVESKLKGLQFAFKTPSVDPAARSLSQLRVSWCGGADVVLAADSPGPHLPADQRVLFLLGAQQPASWLRAALTAHAAFLPAHVHASSELAPAWLDLHVFDSWPQPSLEDFVTSFDRPAGARRNRSVLLDSTGDYLFSSAAAPRIARAVPQARFVVVLMDPVSRAHLAWREMLASGCSDTDFVDCHALPTFAEVVNAYLDSPSRMGCSFARPDTTLTWNDCFKCAFHRLDETYCSGVCAQHQPCTGSAELHPVDTGNYAAQLAWWLQFFSPDRFLVISAATLRSPGRRDQVLKRIAQHAGLEDPSAFSAQLLSMLPAYNSVYRGAMDEADREAVVLLRQFYHQSLRDLRELLRVFAMDGDFEGLEVEM